MRDDEMMGMDEDEFIEWLRSMIRDGDVFMVVMGGDDDDDDEIPYEAHDMDKKVHFRRACPHHNMHGTRDVEVELDGHHVVMRGYHNGQRMLGEDGEWPVVQRLDSDDDALRLYLHARKKFVENKFEIVDA